MTLDDSVRKSIFEYPSLFKDMDYAKSRIKVLDHLFLVIGNGYEWYDGYLAASVCKKKGRGFKKPENYGKEKFTKKLDEAYFKTTTYRMFDHHPEILKLIKENPTFGDLGKIEDRSLYLPTPYPVCEYSAIVTAPANIRPDWLAGAIETTEWALSFYTGPDELLRQLSYQKTMNYKPEVLTKLATKHTEILWKALNNLRQLEAKSKKT